MLTIKLLLEACIAHSLELEESIKNNYHYNFLKLATEQELKVARYAEIIKSLQRMKEETK